MQAFQAEAVKLPIQCETDVVSVRHQVRLRGADIGLSLVNQTKFVTAASEIARNTLIYGKGGWVTFEICISGFRKGLKLVFEDKGPGIPDIDQALKDGFTTGSGLGMGLGGTRRLVNEFEIQSTPGQGTRVSITMWK